MNASASAAVLGAIPARKTVMKVCYTAHTASYATSYMNMLGYEAQNLKFGMCGWTANQTINLGKWDNVVSSQYATWLTTVPNTWTATHAPPVINTGKVKAEEILRERARVGFAAGWKTITIGDLYNDIAVNNGSDYFIFNYFASP